MIDAVEQILLKNLFNSMNYSNYLYWFCPLFIRKSKHSKAVIPASKARQESFLKKDSGQAGMTEERIACIYGWILNRRAFADR